MAKQKNGKGHYTITSQYLYLHDKKKIRKSNHVWRIDLNCKSMCYSSDGGKIFRPALSNDFDSEIDRFVQDFIRDVEL